MQRITGGIDRVGLVVEQHQGARDAVVRAHARGELRERIGGDVGVRIEHHDDVAVAVVHAVVDAAGEAQISPG